MNGLVGSPAARARARQAAAGGGGGAAAAHAHREAKSWRGGSGRVGQATRCATRRRAPGRSAGRRRLAARRCLPPGCCRGRCLARRGPTRGRRGRLRTAARPRYIFSRSRFDARPRIAGMRGGARRSVAVTLWQTSSGDGCRAWWCVCGGPMRANLGAAPRPPPPGPRYARARPPFATHTHRRCVSTWRPHTGRWLASPSCSYRQERAVRRLASRTPALLRCAAGAGRSDCSTAAARAFEHHRSAAL